MQNWIVWNRTVLTFNWLWEKKLYLYWTELFKLELFNLTEYLEIEKFLNCVLMLNLFAWNWTDYVYKNGFGIK